MYYSACYYAAAVALLVHAELPIDRRGKWYLQNGPKMGQMVDFESPKYTSLNSFGNSGEIRILRGFQIRPQTSSSSCCRGGQHWDFWTQRCRFGSFLQPSTQLQVRCLLKVSWYDLSVFDGECHVQEVDQDRRLDLFNIPLQYSKIVIVV